MRRGGGTAVFHSVSSGPAGSQQPPLTMPHAGNIDDRARHPSENIQKCSGQDERGRSDMTCPDRIIGRTDLPDQEGLEMRQRQYGPEEVAAKLRQVGMLVGQGMLVTRAIRRIGVSDSTYYRWRADRQEQAEQISPNPGQTQRFHQLEVENKRLRCALADVMIERQVLKEAAAGVA